MIDKRLLALAILSKNRSFTKTAKILFITQPAVSQQITSLETELNLELVHREHGQISLTENGLRLANFAWQVDVEGKRLLTSIRNRRKFFKMGCTLSLSATLLPKFIDHPLENFKITAASIHNTAHILQNIRDGQLDFGLIEGNFNKTEFGSIFIQNEPFICATYPENTLPIHPSMDQLFAQRVLVREEGSGSRKILENWLATKNYQISDFQDVIEIASPATIIQLLQQKFGLSFIYRSLVTELLNQGTLKEIQMHGFEIVHPINLVFLKHSYFEKEYQRIVDAVLQD